MSEFNNVTVVREANVYFDGKVVSRTIVFPDGAKKTLGFMQPGEYTFNTGAPEIMEIMQGEMTVQLPGSDAWRAVKGGESFDVPANSAFTMRVSALSDYCCSFID
ncbi:MAG: pyrimidine/purine nucleoside phosphorylase [Gammaproteobacteria bacterium]|nr:pyrimidine/purine nucleoside phosphorylase [Gammaproteobacteria bacterium]MCP5136901.1 pyrimidine/purine nucleoside phosphorylase [Gammaproteobacteria bacterium]